MHILSTHSKESSILNYETNIGSTTMQTDNICSSMKFLPDVVPEQDSLFLRDSFQSDLPHTKSLMSILENQQSIAEAVKNIDEMDANAFDACMNLINSDKDFNKIVQGIDSFDQIDNNYLPFMVPGDPQSFLNSNLCDEIKNADVPATPFQDPNIDENIGFNNFAVQCDTHLLQGDKIHTLKYSPSNVFEFTENDATRLDPKLNHLKPQNNIEKVSPNKNEVSFSDLAEMIKATLIEGGNTELESLETGSKTFRDNSSTEMELLKADSNCKDTVQNVNIPQKVKFRCEHCNKLLGSSCSLKRHITNFHTNSNIDGKATLPPTLADAPLSNLPHTNSPSGNMNSAIIESNGSLLQLEGKQNLEISNTFQIGLGLPKGKIKGFTKSPTTQCKICDKILTMSYMKTHMKKLHSGLQNAFDMKVQGNSSSASEVDNTSSASQADTSSFAAISTVHEQDIDSSTCLSVSDALRRNSSYNIADASNLSIGSGKLSDDTNVKFNFNDIEFSKDTHFSSEASPTENQILLQKLSEPPLSGNVAKSEESVTKLGILFTKESAFKLKSNTCHVCSKTFARNLKQHLRVKHKIDIPKGQKKIKETCDSPKTRRKAKETYDNPKNFKGRKSKASVVVSNGLPVSTPTSKESNIQISKESIHLAPKVVNAQLTAYFKNKSKNLNCNLLKSVLNSNFMSRQIHAKDFHALKEPASYKDDVYLNSTSPENDLKLCHNQMHSSKDNSLKSKSDLVPCVDTLEPLDRENINVVSEVSMPKAKDDDIPVSSTKLEYTEEEKSFLDETNENMQKIHFTASDSKCVESYKNLSVQSNEISPISEIISNVSKCHFRGTSNAEESEKEIFDDNSLKLSIPQNRKPSLNAESTFASTFRSCKSNPLGLTSTSISSNADKLFKDVSVPFQECYESILPEVNPTNNAKPCKNSPQSGQECNSAETENIENLSKYTSETIESKLNNIKEIAQSKLEDITEIIENKSYYTAENVIGKSKYVASKSEDIENVEIMSEGMENTQTKLEDITKNVENKFEDNTENVESKLGDIVENVESKSGDITENVESKSGDITKDMESKSGDITGNEESKSGDITGNEESKSGDITENVESKSGDITENENMESKSKVITENVESMPEGITENVEIMPEGTTEYVESIAENVESLPEDITENVESMPEDMTENVKSMPRDTTENEENMPEGITENVESIPEDITKNVEILLEDTTGNVRSVSGDVTKKLESNSEAIAKGLDSKSADAVETFKINCVNSVCEQNIGETSELKDIRCKLCHQNLTSMDSLLKHLKEIHSVPVLKKQVLDEPIKEVALHVQRSEKLSPPRLKLGPNDSDSESVTHFEGIPPYFKPSNNFSEASQKETVRKSFCVPSASAEQHVQIKGFYENLRRIVKSKNADTETQLLKSNSLDFDFSNSECLRKPVASSCKYKFRRHSFCDTKSFFLQVKNNKFLSTADINHLLSYIDVKNTCETVKMKSISLPNFQVALELLTTSRIENECSNTKITDYVSGESSKHLLKETGVAMEQSAGENSSFTSISDVTAVNKISCDISSEKSNFRKRRTSLNSDFLLPKSLANSCISKINSNNKGNEKIGRRKLLFQKFKSYKRHERVRRSVKTNCFCCNKNIKPIKKYNKPIKEIVKSKCFSCHTKIKQKKTFKPKILTLKKSTEISDFLKAHKQPTVKLTRLKEGGPAHYLKKTSSICDITHIKKAVVKLERLKISSDFNNLLYAKQKRACRIMSKNESEPNVKPKRKSKKYRNGFYLRSSSPDILPSVVTIVNSKPALEIIDLTDSNDVGSNTLSVDAHLNVKTLAMEVECPVKTDGDCSVPLTKKCFVALNRVST